MRLISLERFDPKRPKILTITVEEPAPWYRLVKTVRKTYMYPGSGLYWCDAESLVPVGYSKHKDLNCLVVDWFDSEHEVD